MKVTNTRQPNRLNPLKKFAKWSLTPVLIAGTLAQGGHAKAEHVTVALLDCSINGGRYEQGKCNPLAAGSATYTKTRSGPKLLSIEHNFRDINKATHFGVVPKGSMQVIEDGKVLPSAIFTATLPKTQPVVSADNVVAFPFNTSKFTPTPISFQKVPVGADVCVQPDFHKDTKVNAKVTGYQKNYRIYDSKRTFIGTLPYAMTYDKATDFGSSGSGIQLGKCKQNGPVIAVLSASNEVRGIAVPLSLYANSFAKGSTELPLVHSMASIPITLSAIISDGLTLVKRRIT